MWFAIVSVVSTQLMPQTCFQSQWCNFLLLLTCFLERNQSVLDVDHLKSRRYFCNCIAVVADCISKFWISVLVQLESRLKVYDRNFNRQNMEAISADEIESKLQEFKSWISNQHDLPQNTEEILLLRFLKVAKWRVEKAQRFFRHSIQMRTSNPLIFSQRDPMSQNIQKVFDVMWVRD